MRIIRFNSVSNALKLEPHGFEDLYLLAMVISKEDIVESRSYRRFRSNENDVGEQKEVTLEIRVEKVEIDKNASRLRLIGKIIGGYPEEFVTINSYHTINVAPNDILDIKKPEWKDYIIRRIRQAVLDSKKPKLSIIVIDDEKATVAYIKGYGIEIITEIYSKLSKRMKEKDYAKQREQYFNEIIKTVNDMKVDIVILAGPGFTKDEIKRYIREKNIEMTKSLIYTSASDAERSGIREVMQSPVVSKVIEREHVKKEFEYLNYFILGLKSGSSLYGANKIKDGIESQKIGVVMVNDSVINDEDIRKVLDLADKKSVKIEIFNSDDDAGSQLKNFGNIAGLSEIPED